MKNKKLLISVLLVLAMFINSSAARDNSEIDDQFSYAKTRTNDLRLSIYITAHAINDLLANEAGRREAISIFRGNGITKAYIEVYRSGLVIEKSVLEKVRDSFLKNGIEVVGGIATVPGGDFGVKQVQFY